MQYILINNFKIILCLKLFCSTTPAYYKFRLKKKLHLILLRQRCIKVKTNNIDHLSCFKYWFSILHLRIWKHTVEVWKNVKNATGTRADNNASVSTAFLSCPELPQVFSWFWRIWNSSSLKFSYTRVVIMDQFSHVFLHHSDECMAATCMRTISYVVKNASFRQFSI